MASASNARTVLLVDDEPHVRRIAELALRGVGGFSVLVASSADEAVELAARERPDVVLLDVMMPGKDGPAALAALRAAAATAAIPVIFLTGKGKREDVDRYLGLGALGVVHKPFDPMRLAQQVTQILAGDREVA